MWAGLGLITAVAAPQLGLVSVLSSLDTGTRADTGVAAPGPCRTLGGHVVIRLNPCKIMTLEISVGTP